MEWQLTLASEESITLRDTGIDDHRWASLRSAIIYFGNHHGVGIAEDPECARAVQESSATPEQV